MSTLKYVNINRIFSKIGRDIKDTEVNETDVIEWIGEALEFLEVPQILVEEVKFIEVKDYHIDMPKNLHMITQIAKNSNFNKKETSICDIEEEETDKPICKEVPKCGPEEPLEVTPFSLICDSDTPLDNLPADYALAFLNAEETQYMQAKTFNKLNLDWTYDIWTSSNYYKNNFVPVRLATGTFFNSLVCREKDVSLYKTCSYEYTIVGETEKRIRFNFKDGEVAISYLRNSVDEETGYPLIPDNISYITAITYYIKWKIAEGNDWAGRDGWTSKAERAEEKWLKYAKQAKSYMKMPKTLDQYQNLLEQSHHLIPNHRRYYGFFGNLGKAEHRDFQNFNIKR